MGTCWSKKKEPSTKADSKAPSQQNKSVNSVSVTLTKPAQPEELTLEKNKTVQETQQEPESVKSEEGQAKKEIFIIKHRKSHDERERISKIPPFTPQKNLSAEKSDGVASNENNKVSLAPSTPNVGGVRTSSCTKEEVDAILIQCGRLSRSSSGRAASSSNGECRRKYSGSKRSFDFDHCDNNDNDTTTSCESDQRRANSTTETREGRRPRHRQSPRRSSPNGRRRTPSRERDQPSNSRERRVSKSPGRRSPSRRSSETTTTFNANGSNKPSKMVTVPPTVSSLVMDKSNNGEASGIKRITVKRNVGDGGVVGSRSAASPRSQSPARANGNVGNGRVLNENQQNQPSLSRNNSARKAEQSPYRRNPLSEVDANSLSYPQSNNSNVCNKVQSKATIEVEATQKPNVDMNDTRTNRTSSRVALDKTVNVNFRTKEQQEEDIKVLSSLPDNAVMKNVMPSGVDIDNNLKPQTLTRSRSSRRSRDLDINPEAILNPPQSYTSLLLEDIQNFHQKNTQQQPSISLPACLTKACSILEAVADLNSTTSSNFSAAFSEHNHYGRRKDPFIESEVVVSDDVMEPSLHKYVTVKRGGSVDLEDQESSGSNSFTVSSSQKNHLGSISSSSWEPNSADSRDCWSSRLEECGLSCEEARKKTLNCNKRRECDHEHSSGIGRGRLIAPAATA